MAQRNLNKVFFDGRLTRDPEVSFTQGNVQIGKFSLASNYSYKPSSGGSLVEEVNYFDCVCFGKQAEVVGKYLHKGSRILFEGRAKNQRWKDKTDGSNRSKIEFVMEEFHFLDSKKDGEGPARSQPTTHNSSGTQDPIDFEPLGDDEVPF